MTSLVTPDWEQLDPDGVESEDLIHRPLWIVAGQLGVIAAVVFGFGAKGGIPPKGMALLVLTFCAAAIVLAPQHRWRRIVVTGPLIAFCAWWLASYLWTSNTFGWWADTEKALPFVLALILLAGLLPARAFTMGLVLGCYVAIAFTVFQLLTRPGVATVNPDGVPGWRGSFIHKNQMGPFMVFAVLTLASFDKPSLRRNLAIGVSVVLIVMSQSATALSAGLVTLVVCVLLSRIAVGSRPTRATLAVSTVGVLLLATITSSFLFSTVLGLQGKDTTLSRRTDVWDAVVPVIERQPLQGYGVGGVWGNPAVDPGRSIMRHLGFTVFHAHNGLLEILLLLGVIGLVLYLWLVASAVRLGFVNLREDTRTSVFTVGYVVLLVMLSVSEVVVFGVWLGVLAAFQVILTKTDARRKADNSPAVRLTAPATSTRRP